jgi:hypothetical protein
MAHEKDTLQYGVKNITTATTIIIIQLNSL